MRRWLLTALSLLGLLVLPLAPSALAQSENLTTWGVVPANAEGEADGRISFRHVAEPGDTITEHALVTNYSEQAVTFALAGAAGTISPDGSFDILDPEEAGDGHGSWITIEDSVRIEAGESAAVPFTVAVPQDALPGDHPAGIVVGLATPDADDGALGVGFEARVGLRIHLRVDGDITPRLEVQDLTTSYEGSWNPFAPGRLVIDYTVANTGNVRLATKESLEVSGLLGAGTTVTPDESTDATETLPGGSQTMSTVVDGVWPLGPLTTTVTATPSVIGADDLGDTTLEWATAQQSTWAVPWVHLILLAALVAIVLFLRHRRRQGKAAYAAALEAARREGAASAAGGTPSTEPAVDDSDDDSKGVADEESGEPSTVQH